MLIGIDVSRANRAQKTGVEWYAFHLLKHFYKLDKNSSYSLYTDQRLTADLLPLPENFMEKVLKWPLNRFWTLGRMSLEMIFKKPDLLFIPSHTFPVFGGKKNVITWHDVGYEKYPESYTAWELASLKQGAKRAFKLADKILTVSNFTKAEMVRIYGIEESRIKVIYPGCNHEFWQPASAENIKQVLDRYKINRPYFIFLSRLTLRKNPIGMIRMYNSFREKIKIPHYLLLVGREETFLEETNEEIKNSPFKNEIIKLGWLPTVDLPALLSGAQALVFPSIYEGFGLTTIEAMACGVPVIASNSGALPEVIKDAGLMAKTHDIEAFADLMVKISQDEHLRADLISKGYKRSQEFTWDKCAKETLDVLLTI